MRNLTRFIRPNSLAVARRLANFANIRRGLVLVETTEIVCTTGRSRPEARAWLIATQVRLRLSAVNEAGPNKNAASQLRLYQCQASRGHLSTAIRRLTQDGAARRPDDHLLFDRTLATQESAVRYPLLFLRQP